MPQDPLPLWGGGLLWTANLVIDGRESGSLVAFLGEVRGRRAVPRPLGSSTLRQRGRPPTGDAFAPRQRGTPDPRPETRTP